MTLKYNIYQSIILAVIIFIITPCLGDTISLNDGTLLVGKIIEEDDEKIIFNNAFGLFTIKKKQIIEKHVTEDYREDINIIIKLGKSYDEKEVKDNFDAGTRAKDKLAGGKKSRWYDGGMFSFSSLYFITTGKMNTVLPSGFYFTCAYENSLDFIIGGEKRLWMPWIRAEAGYMMYKKDPALVAGPVAAIGPVWKFDIIKNRYGTIVVSPLTGMAFLKIEYEDDRETSNTLISHLIIGYEYRLGMATLSAQGRYKYIYDRDIDFNGIGGGISAGVSFW